MPRAFDDLWYAEILSFWEGMFAPIEEWFRSQAWAPFPFQRTVWKHYAEGQGGLLHSATGTGKTLAAWLGPVAEGLAAPNQDPRGLRVLWITPLRALAADTEL